MFTLLNKDRRYIRGPIEGEFSTGARRANLKNAVEEEKRQ
jgi:hypothetical protein